MPFQSRTDHRERSARRGVARWGPSSVRGRLVLLTFVLMAPALLVGGLLLRDAAQRERRAVESQLLETARALASGVDRQIGQDRALLNALATSPNLMRGEYSAFDVQARAASPEGVAIVVRNSSGQHLVNTRMPSGASPPLTSEGGGVTWAVDNGRMRVSNLFRGSISGADQVVVQRRMTGLDGRPIDIATVRPAISLGAILDEQKLPTTWVGTIVDARGAVIARSRNPERFIGRPGSPDLVRQMATTTEGVTESQMLDGPASLMAYSRARDSRWAVVVAMPKAELTAASRRALAWAGFMGFTLLACGLLAAAWVAENVARPIEALAAYAGGLGTGSPRPRPRTRLREADAVGSALARSAQALREREDELRRFNATLESRIAERTRELAETTESLIQAQKLEAVGRLTGGIAHDFNNLLTAVQGNLELLARRVTDERLSKYIEHARQAAERGASLTAQLLAFSRRQRLTPEPTDVNASVETAAKLLNSTLGRTIRLNLALQPGLWPGMADATQLELVILNLAINARDAMPTGGAITIETANVHYEKASPSPEAPPPGEYVVIAVADTGSGMTPEVLARVFEPFFTTKEVGRGSGLGLPQVLGVAKQLGGGVEVSSQLGLGTTVRVYLPRAAAGVTAGPAPSEQAAEVQLHGLRILLVDDDPDVRGVAAAMLGEAGCQVRNAASGREALQSLAADPEVDIVLLDYAMPGLNGGETAGLIQKRWPKLPVLLMSGYADAATLSETWRGPFLHKPFSVTGLSAQIAKLIGSSNVVPLRSARP